MAAQIQALIDKVDVTELVRDQIAGILLVESQEQQRLAGVALKDARLWKLNVFAEASNPWEQFRDPPDGEKANQGDYTPIVNVWFDKAETDRSKSTTVNRKSVDGTFNVDCYGYGLSSATAAGHEPGDTSASLEAQRAARLVRNILESSYYVNLGLVKVVGDRHVQTIQQFQPPQDQKNASHVAGVRLVVVASYNEFSPQYQGQPFETAVITVTRSPSGAVSVFNFPPVSA